MMRLQLQKRRGGTIVEIILSVAIISTLFIVASSKIEIGDLFSKLFSTEGGIGTRAIGEALTNYRWDHGGEVPPDSNITSTLQPICKQTTSQVACTASGGVYLQALIENAMYLTNIVPHTDYVNAEELMTGYKIAFPVQGGRVQVTNPDGSEEFVY